jgi:heme-degrading monooxygenase HmoA
MYVSRCEVTIDAGRERDFIAEDEAMHAGMRTMAGFRWAMLLRSIDNPGKLASVAMWLTREQAQAWRDSEAAAAVHNARKAQDRASPQARAQEYDVATARGSMTPAAFAAIVDWQVDLAISSDFVNRWNAAFHAIEDRLGSRLLQDLGQPTLYAGMHVASNQAHLTPEILAAEIADGGGLRFQPTVLDRFEVVLLTEP